MEKVIQDSLQSLHQQGYRGKIVAISRLAELRESLEKLYRDGSLDKSFYEEHLRYFKYDYAKALPEARAIYVVSVPQPITRLHFAWQGRVYAADIPPTYISRTPDARVAAVLNGVLNPAGFKAVRTNLPVKTLAVRSGLAQYGRNNITYIPGQGSFHRLAGFYADIPCEADDWQAPKVMKACEECTRCIKNCPTAAISRDRFIIHAERCLTLLNESEKDFPDWVQPEWHNAIVGCLRCQLVCPVDKKVADWIETGLHFSTEETGLILQKTPFAQLPPELRQKLESTDLTGYLYQLLARNLKVLMR